MVEDVVISRSALKKAARECMNRGDFNVYLVFPLSISLTLLFSFFKSTFLRAVSYETGLFFSLIFAIISFFVFTPITIANIRFFILYSRGENPPTLVAFNPFKKELYWRFLFVVFWESLWLSIWAACIYILCFAMLLFFEVEPDDVLVLAAIVIIGVSLSVYAVLNYFTAFYLIADKKAVKVTKSLKMSRIIMKGHKWELFLLVLSFLPWFLLSVITCGLALIYVFPYIQLTLAKYYDFVMKKTLRDQHINC